MSKSDPSMLCDRFCCCTLVLTNCCSSSVAIGFSGKDVSLSRPPGWEPDSWAYHGDDGHTFACQSSGRHYGPEFSTGDVIGCGINFRTGNAFFTRNGENLGEFPCPYFTYILIHRNVRSFFSLEASNDNGPGGNAVSTSWHKNKSWIRVVSKGISFWG